MLGSFPSPVFPVSQVFTVFGIQVRAPVANTLGLAILYKMCPDWLLNWFSLGAGLSATLSLQVSKFPVKKQKCQSYHRYNAT